METAGSIILNEPPTGHGGDHLGGDDGAGRAEDWQEWNDEMRGVADFVEASPEESATKPDPESVRQQQELVGGRGYTVEDVGRNAARAAFGTALGGAEVQTHRAMPRHTGMPPVLGPLALGRHTRSPRRF